MCEANDSHIFYAKTATNLLLRGSVGELRGHHFGCQQRIDYDVECDEAEERLGQELRPLPPYVSQVENLRK